MICPAAALAEVICPIVDTIWRFLTNKFAARPRALCALEQALSSADDLRIKV